MSFVGYVTNGTNQKISFANMSLREASQIDFVHEQRHMDVLLETPPPPLLETSRTFFDFPEARVALFILQPLRLSVVYEGVKEHLGQSQDLIISIHIYLKYKYTYENAGYFLHFVMMISKY